LNVSTRIAYVTFQPGTDGRVLSGLSHVVGRGDERLFALDFAKDIADGSIVGHVRDFGLFRCSKSVLSRLPD